MDIPKQNTETLVGGENAPSLGIESSSISETVSSTPTPPQDISNDDTVVVAASQTASAQSAIVVSEDDIVDLTNSTVEEADNNWVGRVRNVIKDDEGNPYQEEADAEVLNEEYMKARFNVDVDAPIEEK